ncbi:NUDIX domain-containing protein [Streptomyces sp. NPDC048290]|uniref:NUDIX domain-containing protein n=1 Tax=Streptomyces sp. NPDC048290 TaxID=3155811 RepID=UPI00342B6EED
MENRGPWRRHATRQLITTPHFTAQRDEVTRPDGARGRYDWVAAPDQIRVAALVGDGILVVEQHHYLAGQLWQLPGGSVDPEDAGPRAAAERELAEETGYRGGEWHDHGHLYPLPGLTACRVHLWRTTGPLPGPASPEAVEADLRVRHVPLAEAVRAVRDGRLRCAPSAALVLAVSAPQV